MLLTLLALTGAMITASPTPAAPHAPSPAAAGAALTRAYPDVLIGVQGGDLLWKDGARMPLGTVRDVTPGERLSGTTLADMFAAPYPACAPLTLPATDAAHADPGRARSGAFFSRLYGGSEAAVRRQLVPLDWFGQRLMVAARVAPSLRRVEAALGAQPALRPYLTPSAGTFVWRAIAGTDRRSLHSYGAAIDLNVSRSAYWLWDQRKGKVAYRNQFPAAVVTAFEREGWIWGGRWAHYDTMHFEYRPELSGCGR